MQRPTILLAEDDPQVRHMIRAVLLRNGFEVVEAGNGMQALALSRSHPADIDLAVIDVMMPGMGGLDLAVALDPQRPSMKVLYISGNTSTVAVESLASGAPELLLRKPFTPDELLQRVREALAPGPPGQAREKAIGQD